MPHGDLWMLTGLLQISQIYAMSYIQITMCNPAPLPPKKTATMANEWEHCDYEKVVMYIFRTHLYVEWWKKHSIFS